MNNIKMITLFHPHQKTPFMICIVNKVEDTEHGVKFTLETVMIFVLIIIAIICYPSL